MLNWAAKQEILPPVVAVFVVVSAGIFRFPPNARERAMAGSSGEISVTPAPGGGISAMVGGYTQFGRCRNKSAVQGD